MGWMSNPLSEHWLRLDVRPADSLPAVESCRWRFSNWQHITTGCGNKPQESATHCSLWHICLKPLLGIDTQSQWCEPVSPFVEFNGGEKPVELRKSRPKWNQESAARVLWICMMFVERIYPRCCSFSFLILVFRFGDNSWERERQRICLKDIWHKI